MLISCFLSHIIMILRSWNVVIFTFVNYMLLSLDVLISYTSATGSFGFQLWTFISSNLQVQRFFFSLSSLLVSISDTCLLFKVIPKAYRYVAQIYNASSQEAEAGGVQVWSHSKLCRKILDQKENFRNTMDLHPGDQRPLLASTDTGHTHCMQTKHPYT